MVKNSYYSEAQEGPQEARKVRGCVYVSRQTKRREGPSKRVREHIKKAAIIAAARRDPGRKHKKKPGSAPGLFVICIFLLAQRSQLRGSIK